MGYTWTGRRSAAGLDAGRQTHSHLWAVTNKHNPSNRKSLDCGRKREYPERRHLATGENMETAHRKDPDRFVQ